MKRKKQQRQKSESSRSHSSDLTISDSLCISTGNESDSQNMDIIRDGVESQAHAHAIPPALSVLNMPKISKKRPNGYCSQCTHYAIQLSQLTKDLHALRMSLGETQMTLDSAMQETAHWKKKYVELKQEYESGINYKHKYTQLQSQIGALLNNSNNSSNHNHPKSIS